MICVTGFNGRPSFGRDKMLSDSFKPSPHLKVKAHISVQMKKIKGFLGQLENEKYAA